ncbi:MAG: AtpZ/AtpI family protein [Ignavibacteria bacterium]|nr:AtpZ/AtpI family protein [Ignavibacteria bacterium]
MSSKIIDNQRKVIEGYKKIGPYLGLGTQLAATVIVMFYLGYWLDEKFQTKPILVIVFSMLGAFAAIYNFIRSVLKISNQETKNKK